MSAFSSTQISKPTDEQVFERACLVLFRCLLNDPNVQFNAKRGQEQNGVDIFGFRNQDHSKPVGVQCKLKGPRARLTAAELQGEIAKAIDFQPALREYFVVTTASDDGELQRIAREKSVELASDGRSIAINVWGWETLEQRIGEHPEARNAFDPTFGPYAQLHTELLANVRDSQADSGARLLAVSTELTEVKSILLATRLPSDAPDIKDALEAELDAEIDSIRELLSSGRPKAALPLLESLLKRIENSASGRILFRVKANIGHSHLYLGDEARASHWLSEAYSHAQREPKAIANFALALLLVGKVDEAREFGARELGADPTNVWLASLLSSVSTNAKSPASKPAIAARSSRGASLGTRATASFAKASASLVFPRTKYALNRLQHAATPSGRPGFSVVLRFCQILRSTAADSSAVCLTEGVRRELFFNSSL